MSDLWRLRVEGAPHPKGSPAIMRGRGGRPFVLEKREQRAHEQAIREHAALTPPDPAMREQPCCVDVAFVLAPPKRVIARRKATRTRPGCDVRAAVKPDVDKLLRTVLDGLAGVAYRDDAQVVRVGGTKRYAFDSETPHTVIVVRYFDREVPWY